MSNSRLRQQLMGAAAGQYPDKNHPLMTTERANCHPFRAYNLSDYARRLDSLFNGRRLKRVVNDGRAHPDLACLPAGGLRIQLVMEPLPLNKTSRSQGIDVEAHQRRMAAGGWLSHASLPAQ